MRSRRQFYIRLETWLSRFGWEEFGAGHGLAAELILGEVHYIRHLRLKRPPCERCPLWVQLRHNISGGWET